MAMNNSSVLPTSVTVQKNGWLRKNFI